MSEQNTKAQRCKRTLDRVIACEKTERQRNCNQNLKMFTHIWQATRIYYREGNIKLANILSEGSSSSSSISLRWSNTLQSYASFIKFSSNFFFLFSLFHTFGCFFVLYFTRCFMPWLELIAAHVSKRRNRLVL